MKPERREEEILRFIDEVKNKAIKVQDVYGDSDEIFNFTDGVVESCEIIIAFIKEGENEIEFSVIQEDIEEIDGEEDFFDHLEYHHKNI